MKKERKVLVCDVCEEEINEDYEHYSCSICGKDMCDSCYTQLNDEEGWLPFAKLKICYNCLSEDEMLKEVKKWFKQEEVKKEMATFEDKLKTYLIKLVMLKRC